MRTLIFIFIFALTVSNAHSVINWKQHLPKEEGFDKAKLDKLFNYMFDKKYKHNTDAALIIRNGKLIKEQYSNGYSLEHTHRTWSISKSVTNTLIGIAVHKNILNLQAKVKDFYPQLTGDKSDTMTLDHLMKMSSGIDWKEHYEENPFSSDVIKMLYVYEYKDMAGYTASRPVIYDPGKRFYYSSGESNLIMGMLKKSMGISDYENFPWKHLFNKLGITSATWERDGKDVFVGSSYLFLSPRDLSKIGQLYLQNGIWNKEQILPKDWVKYSTTPNKAWLLKQENDEVAKPGYGAQWWLNAQTKNGLSHPHAPDDIYMALGHHGQILAVLPSQNIIFVRMGADKDEKIDRKEIFKLLMSSLK
ncbi:MAG: serine hydrolase [Bacteriovoracaceae bacterium]|nr:serine hydrolase [Bacteriovoracaceae bacterium]